MKEGEGGESSGNEFDQGDHFFFDYQNFRIRSTERTTPSTQKKPPPSLPAIIAPDADILKQHYDHIPPIFRTPQNPTPKKKYLLYRKP